MPTRRQQLLHRMRQNPVDHEKREQYYEQALHTPALDEYVIY